MMVLSQNLYKKVKIIIYILVILLVSFVNSACVQQPNSGKKLYNIRTNFYKNQDLDLKKALKAGNRNKLLTIISPDSKRIISDFHKFNKKKSLAKIMVLLPLTGKHRKLGQEMLDSMMLALSDLKQKNIIIIPVDVEADSYFATNAIKQAVKNNVKIILGPLFSDQTIAIAKNARQNNITILSFSNNPEAIVENNVYSIGLNQFDEVKNILKYTSEKEIKTFVTVAPANKFGSLMVSSLRNSLKKNGEKVVKTEFYLSNKQIGHSLSMVLKELVRYQLNKNMSYVSEPKNDNIDVNLLYDTVDELEQGDYIPLSKKAILILDNSAKRQQVISEYLKKKYANLDVVVLGINTLVGTSLYQPRINHSIYASANREFIKQYAKYFYNQFKYQPSTLSTISYDAISLISNIVNKSKMRYSPQLMLTPEYYYLGINGKFHFNKNRMAERMLNIYQVSDNDSIIVYKHEDNISDKK